MAIKKTPFRERSGKRIKGRSEVDFFALLYECASRYYNPERNPTREQLAAEYGRDPSTIARWLTKARNSKIVQFRVVPRLPDSLTVERDARLEDALRQRFRLGHCVVVGGFADENWQNAVSGEQVDYFENYLHALIAYGFVAYIASVRFRKGDHIGVGGGRGNWFWASYMPECDWSQGQVSSLTGHTASQLWGPLGVFMESMDADYVALKLHMVTAAQPNLVGLPVAPDFQYEVPAYLSEGAWGEELGKVPGIAVMGVGTITGSHCFMRYEAYNFRGVREHLERLVNKLNELEFSPVGDRLNRLFYAGPPAGCSISDSDATEIKGLIEKINCGVVSITDSQFKQIEEVWLVSGGSRKVHTIRAALDALTNPTRCLCTDVGTAKRLLG